MDAKHTQWRIEPEASRDGRRGYWIQDGEDYVALACIRNDEAEEIKNARLIAAAPNLLAELESIANADPAKWDAEVRDQFREWAQSRARSAIAKATQPEPTP